MTAGDDGPSEATRRQLATAAARKIKEVQEKLRALSAMADHEVVGAYAQGRDLARRQLEERILAVLTSFGFASEQELRDEIRSLRDRDPTAVGGGTRLGPTDTSLIR